LHFLAFFSSALGFASAFTIVYSGLSIKPLGGHKGSALHLVNAVGPEPARSPRPLAAPPLANFTTSTRTLAAVLDHIYVTVNSVIYTACGP
jgi:hypothetical protein